MPTFAGATERSTLTALPCWRRAAAEGLPTPSTAGVTQIQISYLILGRATTFQGHFSHSGNLLRPLTFDVLFIHIVLLSIQCLAPQIQWCPVKYHVNSVSSALYGMYCILRVNAVNRAHVSRDESIRVSSGSPGCRLPLPRLHTQPIR